MKMIYEGKKIANVKYEFYEGHVCSDNSTFHLVMDECRGREYSSGVRKGGNGGRHQF